MNFYQKYTAAGMELIQEIDGLTPLEEQPPFIHRMLVNGEEVVFLGEKPKDLDQYLYHFIRIDRMVIPGFARLVNSEILLRQLPPLRPCMGKLYDPVLDLPDEKPYEDTSSIDVTVDGLFYEGKLERNVVLNIAGLITDTIRTKRHFHHCHNYQVPSPPEAKVTDIPKTYEDHSGPVAYEWGSGGLSAENNCGNGHLSSYFEEEVLKHKLVLFYIDVDDFSHAYLNELVELIEIGEFANDKIKVIGTIQENLSAYFKSEDVDKVYPGMDLNWGDPSEPIIKGIFLMPMLFPDQRIIYLCLLNKANESNGGLTIKENLRRWLEAVKCVNESPADRELYIGSGDLDYAGIDQLAILLGKHAFPVVADEDMLHDFIKASKLSVKGSGKSVAR